METAQEAKNFPTNAWQMHRLMLPTFTYLSGCFLALGYAAVTLITENTTAALVALFIAMLASFFPQRVLGRQMYWLRLEKVQELILRYQQEQLSAVNEYVTLVVTSFVLGALTSFSVFYLLMTVIFPLVSNSL
jgi:hypothetical protein